MGPSILADTKVAFIAVSERVFVWQEGLTDLAIGQNTSQ